MPVTINNTCAPRTTVMVADDSPAMREGLARLVADECDLAYAGSAATGAELRKLVAQEAPKVLVMELRLPDEDGLALIEDLLEIAPQTRIVVFTVQPEEVYAARCLRAGARAFLTKRDAVHTLFRAIRDAAVGGTLMSSGVSGHVFGASDPKTSGTNGLATELTNRELQVFRLVGLAQPTREIAGRLGVSVKTIETHRENIKNKLGLQSHAELVAEAARWLRESGGL